MSKTSLELQWERPGPALDQARGALRRGLLAAGLPPYWDEWRADDGLLPRHLRRAWGLAIVVNGQAVWRHGEPLPGPEELGARITLASRARFRVRSSEPLARRLRYSLLPALGLVLLPKCPLCWAAYAGIVTGGGLATWVPNPRILGLSLGLALAASVAAVTLRAQRATDRRPVALATLGAVTVLVGRFALGSVTLTALGFVALAAAAGLAASTRAARGGFLRRSGE